MKPLWDIDGDDVETLQGDSPRFVRFLNALLSGQAHAGGIPHAALQLNQKDTEPDGGVDAAVERAIPPDRDPTGWFGVPTCWQFKAMPPGHIKVKGKKGGQEAALRFEINKPYAKRLVEAGYSYRLCIAADLPPDKKGQWEGWLLEAARTINPKAPAPMVLTASDLALWANRFKGLVAEYYRPLLAGFRSLEAWRREITGLTPEFVPIREWEGAIQAIQRHVRFDRPVRTVLTIQGEAGVGKSRCTHEALISEPGNGALVVYTSDEQAAVEFAQAVARDDRARAILVADECSLEARERLRQLLPGCAERFRVVAIDNSLQRAGGAGEVRLTHLDVADVETILERNFPSLPADRRLGYARLAQGFVRLAVDLCEHDWLVPPDGRVDSVFGFFRDFYLENRLPADDLKAVLLISLLPRVGYRDNMAGQLEGLCRHRMINCPAAGVVETAQRLHQSPGFVAFAGRFLYVTPVLIAQVAFQSAWERWIAPDPPRFLAEFPTDLIDPFMERVQGAGTPEMRQAVSDFFLDWARGLTPESLGREAEMLRLVRLIEVQPGSTVAVLRGLVEAIRPDELRQLHSTYEGENARRQLVWLAEKLARFEEYFADAEALLLHLAVAETEPHLGNNASELWTALFRIVLSGTPIPFSERLRLLEARLRTADAAQLRLALAALEGILMDGPVTRLATPPLLFGRVAPPQWCPANNRERWVCRDQALLLARRLVSEGGPTASGIQSLVAERLAPLLLGGHLEQVKAILGAGPFPDALLATLLRGLEDFLDVWCEDRSSRRSPPRGDRNGDGTGNGSPGPDAQTPAPRIDTELEAQVRDWYRSLVPSDLHGRLVTLVGQDPWHHQLHRDHAAWEEALRQLAEELLHSPSALTNELCWLCSPEARSAYHLGRAFGEEDQEATLAERMILELPPRGGVPLARGYLERLTAANPQHLGRVNALLDRLQSEHPLRAYEVIWSSGDEVRKVPRLFQMVDAGGLPADFLRVLEYGVWERELTAEELRQALERLIPAARAGNGRAAQAAVHLLYRRLHPDRTAPDLALLREAPWAREAVFTTLELSLEAGGREAYLWTQLAEDLARVERPRGIPLAVRALASEDYNTRRLAEGSLTRLAAEWPEEVMRSFGQAALNPGTGWRYRLDDLSGLLKAIPIGVVQAWLDRTGVAGARAIAHHLEPPHLTDDGTVVPPLTAHVLERFADDEKVFREFLDGTHAGQVYNGDFAAQHEGEAEVARRFLTHPLKRVREWAFFELESGRQQAAFWRDRDAERVHP